MFSRTALSLLLLSSLASPAWAHAHLIKSEPKAGATLGASPHQVKLYFDGQIERQFDRFTVVGRDGKGVRLSAVVQPSLQEVILALPALSPGRYRLTWSVVARDSHRSEGDLTLTIR